MTDGRIVSNPEILGGKPIIAGTRISVEVILEELAGGATIEDLTRDFEITEEDIRGAIGFAAKSMSSDFVFPAAV